MLQKRKYKYTFSSKNTALVRYFCHNFENGGRLYGGLWQQLSKTDRKIYSLMESQQSQSITAK